MFTEEEEEEKIVNEVYYECVISVSESKQTLSSDIGIYRSKDLKIKRKNKRRIT